MALPAEHRHSIRTKFIPILGEQDAEVLLAQFPSREADEPATKDFVRAEIATLRGEMQTSFAEVDARLADARSESKIGLAGIDLKIAAQRAETNAGFARTDERFQELIIEMRTGFAAIAAKFESIDAKFDRVDARFEGVDAKFEGVTARFDSLDETLDSRFKSVHHWTQEGFAESRSYVDRRLLDLAKIMLTIFVASLVAYTGVVSAIVSLVD